jgi:hypothetical protein
MNSQSLEKDDIVIYKNNKFIITYIGNTKFGYKAKLRALNDQFDFWIPVSEIKLYQKTRPEKIRFRGFTPEPVED